MIKSRCLVASTVLFAALLLDAEAKLYKWVDENGETHYGETLPPEDANRDTKLLLKGRITDRNETFDKDKIKGQKKDSAADKALLDAHRRDEALLNSYSNEKEIDLARDRNLSQIDARINSYTTLISSSQSTLDDLHKESESRTQQGRKVPQSLIDDISTTETRIAKLQKDLEANQKEMDSVKARYEADKLHYRELKSKSPGG